MLEMPIRLPSSLRWLPLLVGLLGALFLTLGSASASAAPPAVGGIVTLHFHTHLRTRPFWLDYVRPQSRYLATLDACVDPTFRVVHAGSYDFGNCFLLESSKPGYAPIRLPA